jgi:hypothetical protein
MSGYVVGLVLQHLPTDDPVDMMVAIVLGESADDDGWNVYPSVPRVARLARVSERAVQYKLRDFRSLGFVQVVHQGGGRGKPTEYRIDVEWLLSQPRRVEFRKRKEKGAHGAPIAKRVHGKQLNGAQTVHQLVHPTLDPSVDPSPLSRTPCAGAGASPAGEWGELLETKGWNGRDARRLEDAVTRHGEAVVKQQALDMQTAAGRRPFVSELTEALRTLRDHSNITPPGRRGAGQPAGGTPARKESGHALLARLARGEVQP